MGTSPLDYQVLSGFADRLEVVARDAGHVIMEIYQSDFEVETKDDKSPVTVADEASEAVILEALADVAPDIPFVAEEHVAAHGFPDFEGNTFWLIDALDGTKEFINRRGAFTVNIGLIIEGSPALGIVYAPARDELFRGIVCPVTGQASASVEREGAKADLAVRTPPDAGVTVVGSLSHQVKGPMDDFLSQHTVEDMIAIGSSLKFCLVAEGKADFYPRFGPTSEWDIAAGHAVLRAAGGSVKTFDGDDMLYKKASDDYRNGTFLAAGTP